MELLAMAALGGPPMGTAGQGGSASLSSHSSEAHGVHNGEGPTVRARGAQALPARLQLRARWHLGGGSELRVCAAS
jgi:hypothetical protein